MQVQGAIIASFLAAKYTSKEIEQLLDELNLKLLLDERKTILPYSVAKWMLVYFRLGLYKGNALEKWISEVLARKGLHTFSDLPPSSITIHCLRSYKWKNDCSPR